MASTENSSGRSCSNWKMMSAIRSLITTLPGLLAAIDAVEVVLGDGLIREFVACQFVGPSSGRRLP